MRYGHVPLIGVEGVEWPEDGKYPKELDQLGHHAFAWYSLHPAMIMIEKWLKGRSVTDLISARDYVEHWLNHSANGSNTTHAYQWYDHTVAERQLSLLVIWNVGLELSFDHRFMKRILAEIFKHGDLLANEGFYAANQPTRYHNHAWFQDVALVASAVTIPEIFDSTKWLQIAISRLDDQIANLVTEDGASVVSG